MVPVASMHKVYIHLHGRQTVYNTIQRIPNDIDRFAIHSERHRPEKGPLGTFPDGRDLFLRHFETKVKLLRDDTLHVNNYKKI